MLRGQGTGVLRSPKAAKAVRELRAVIVDDNRHMRTLLRTLLRGYGVREVLEAPDAESGLVLLDQVRADFVIADCDMKPLDGIAFVKKLRRECPPPLCSIPVILITAHTDIRRIQTARDAGVTEALCKPVTAKNLFVRITEIIERPRRFVRAADFIGPDRRRRSDSSYSGPKRRSEDAGIAIEYLPG